jgi:hypothetical protein
MPQRAFAKNAIYFALNARPVTILTAASATVQFHMPNIHHLIYAIARRHIYGAQRSLNASAQAIPICSTWIASNAILCATNAREKVIAIVSAAQILRAFQKRAMAFAQ